MSRFAAGINPGAHVAQGQIIGYVGSTGLASDLMFVSDSGRMVYKLIIEN